VALFAAGWGILLRDYGDFITATNNKAEFGEHIEVATTTGGFILCILSIHVNSLLLFFLRSLRAPRSIQAFHLASTPESGIRRTLYDLDSTQLATPAHSASSHHHNHPEHRQSRPEFQPNEKLRH
jgi:hypothetical protein